MDASFQVPKSLSATARFSRSSSSNLAKVDHGQPRNKMISRIILKYEKFSGQKFSIEDLEIGTYVPLMSRLDSRLSAFNSLIKSI